MTELLITWIASSLVLYLTAVIVPGFVIKSFGSAMLAAAVVGFFNIWIKPIFMFLAFPVNFLTLGLFTFVINAIILRMAAGVLKGFDIKGWGPAILGAIVLTLLHSLMIYLFGSTPPEAAI